MGGGGYVQIGNPGFSPRYFEKSRIVTELSRGREGGREGEVGMCRLWGVRKGR